MPNFVHLHVHDNYSFLDGYGSPLKNAKRAKELGMTALATTNHNHVGGVPEFQKACKEAGIKPILGLEAYWTRDTNILSLPADQRNDMALEAAAEAGLTFPPKALKRDIKEQLQPYAYDVKQYHIILLAINQTGWSNIVKIQSESAQKCTYNGRYLCDDEILAKHSEGVIFMTACIGNVVPTLINRGQLEEAEAQIDAWHKIFGDRMYIEIQPLNIDLQRNANQKLIEWAVKKNIKLTATTDVHYTNFEDHEDHDTLLCIGTGAKKSDETRMHYSNDYWVKSYDEMLMTFGIQADTIKEEDPSFDVQDYMNNVINALANTNGIADLIEDVKLGSDVDLFPKIEIPFGRTPEGYLSMLCFQELYKYKKIKEDKNQPINLKIYEQRLHYELSIINGKGYAPYMLVVQDYIKWANENNCPTGPGRGSGAGSLVVFLLGITKIIDPIEYNLLFFRFLTADRTSPPDIDADFEYYNRDRVVEYLESKYTKECVCHIGTYTEMGVKNGLKDVGRVLGVDYNVMNDMTKKVKTWSDKPNLKFKDLDALNDSDREIDINTYKEFKSYEDQYPDLYRLARAFEGTKRNIGVHASGILITPFPVNELFPTRVDKTGVKITLYSGPELEDLKAIKFDILGLKTISVIKQTLEFIDETLTMENLYDTIDIDDPNMFSNIRNSETEGLFQIESNLFKGVIKNIEPDKMDDIVAITSICRPGPLSAKMDKSYASRKHGKEDAVEPLSGTWDIVKDTYGTIIYQEQLMLIASKVAGFDDNQADSHYRKAFAKKKKDKMDLCRQWFIYGKLNTQAPEGYDKEDKNQPAYDPTGKYGSTIIGGKHNGYSEEELINFWTSTEGYSDYLFNKSHAACYSYITVLTGWLKNYYPVQFMAALLSNQEKEEKLDLYNRVARNMSMEVRVPHINNSNAKFLPENNTITYGLNNIKGVGENSIDEILANRPYNSLSDVLHKVSRKSFNKRVGVALIKAGAFDEFESNRVALINQFYDLRADKDERLTLDYTEALCMEYERETLGTTITYIPRWENIKANEETSMQVEVLSVFMKADKTGKMMAFLTCRDEGCEFTAIAFSKTYAQYKDVLDAQPFYLVLSGKKDAQGSLIIREISQDDEENDNDDFLYSF